MEQVAISQRRQRMRAMREEDLPQIHTLFFKAFPSQKTVPEPEFSDYYRDFFFNNPHYDPKFGSIVHENDKGEIDSAISILPIRYTIQNKTTMGRLLCAFMAEPEKGGRGATELALSFRASEMEFSFTDTASPISARHFEAVGGSTLPIYGLGWTKVFEPVSYVLHQLQSRSGIAGSLFSPSFGKPVDYLLKKKKPLFALKARDYCNVVALDKNQVVKSVSTLLSNFDARPEWTSDDFMWLFGLIDRNTQSGPMISQAVHDKTGELIGTFSYFRRRGKTAEVFSFLARKGTERRVVTNMMRYFEESGYYAAEGLVHPRNLPALSEQRAMFFRHRAHVCVFTRNPEIHNAIAANELYISGLAGEGWSRMMTGF